MLKNRAINLVRKYAWINKFPTSDFSGKPVTNKSYRVWQAELNSSEYVFVYSFQDARNNVALV